jgi:hypothetical protein
MTGHETLIALRNRRLRPAAVAIHVGHVPPCQAGDALEIVVAPDEPIDRLDLRALVGLDVIVAAEQEDGHQRTVRALCMAAVTAGASRVLGGEWKRSSGAPWVEVFRHGVPCN